MALDLRWNLVSAKYFENYMTYYHQILYMHSYWQDLALDCYTLFFGNLYQSYGPLCQNFVFALCLENQLVEFYQILYMPSSLQDLAWDCYASFFANCTRIMALDLRRNIVSAYYLENQLTFFHQILYMHSYWQEFVPELWPLIYTKILFLFNILRTNGQNFTKFYICIHIDKIYVGIVTHQFSHICTRVMALDLLQKFRFRSISWEQMDTDFDQTLYNYLYWQDLCLDC